MTKLVVIREYNVAALAYNDAAFLRSEGIECVVNGDIAGTMMPFITQQITLSTLEEHTAEAEKLLGITTEQTEL